MGSWLGRKIRQLFKSGKDRHWINLLAHIQRNVCASKHKEKDRGLDSMPGVNLTKAMGNIATPQTLMALGSLPQPWNIALCFSCTPDVAKLQLP